MLNKSKTSHLGRLHILTEDEIQAIFHLPDFTDEERLSYFSLTQTEFEVLNGQRSFASKLNFILQLGYFKARHLFFNFEFSDVSADVEFIKAQYFPVEKIEIRDLSEIAVNTFFKHRRTIAGIYNYQFCGHREREMIEQTAKHSARISSKPIYIFREIINFSQIHRIILPGYSFLQDTISKALILEEERLQTLLKNKLSSADAIELDNLLSDSTGLYEITNLKREPRDFSLSEIRRAH